MFCFTLALEEEQENKLEELYNRYHLDLIRFAHSIVKSTEEAEDIVAGVGASVVVERVGGLVGCQGGCGGILDVAVVEGAFAKEDEVARRLLWVLLP